MFGIVVGLMATVSAAGAGSLVTWAFQRSRGRRQGEAQWNATVEGKLHHLDKRISIVEAKLEAGFDPRAGVARRRR